ncbi:FAD dependent oxidoreductase [Daldinia caldariorum]|uniref:FAD dependent oxidoreductase n=1 Tax=Daldinia caldariorum TaxID=326644 RepID=UPI0020082B62|nr:FAD dependent oxidoreductase [Daldinia caldariorum]KAI1470968.1 FAD dependent oxidoreductase [Daldinia caldariorum]
MFARTATATARRQQQFQLGSTTRLFSSTASVRTDFTHVVIGGGAVGLAIARALASHSSSSSSSPSDTTLLLERHPHIGTETSSRNSEVIHAGLYYGASSLKTRLCIRGRERMYAFCAARGVPHARVGKWVVAQKQDGDDGDDDGAQIRILRGIHELCERELGVPTRWVGRAEAAREEPDVRATGAVLESPETGIVDSHALMMALLGQFEEDGGVLALNSAVVGIEPLASGSTTSSSSSSSNLPGSNGWRITVRDAATSTSSTITASTIINSAGLGAAAIHNMIAPADRHVRLYYAKGNYFSYAASSPKVRRLIYPVTAPGAGGLGTHLTLDLAGRMRFGPDVEWVSSPTDLAVNAARLPAAVAEIRKYLPSIDEGSLSPDYAGIRPKLAPAGAVATGGKGFVDFYIRREDGYAGWVNLLGIESPGLTSCLEIGDMVRDMLYGSGKVEESAPLETP